MGQDLVLGQLYNVHFSIRISSFSLAKLIFTTIAGFVIKKKLIEVLKRADLNL
jgi:hypothetical protein